MILLPLLMLFVGIFIFGLIHDWCHDTPPPGALKSADHGQKPGKPRKDR